MASKGDQAAESAGEMMEQFILCYVRNMKMIQAVAAAYHVQTVFVLQPSFFYAYNANYDPLLKSKIQRQHYKERIEFAARCYQFIKYFEKQRKLSDHFLWLADMHEHYKEPIFVDGTHYSARFSREIATQISDYLLEKLDQKKDEAVH